MKIALVSVGTRGDIEPFLFAAEILSERGHQCLCIFPKQLCHLAAEMNLEFAELSPDFLDLVDGEEARQIMAGKISGLKRVQLLWRMYRSTKGLNQKLLDQQKRELDRFQPDRVIFNGKSSYPFAWSAMHNNQGLLLSPVPCLIHASGDYPHIGFPWNLGKTGNRWTYKLANFALKQTFKGIFASLIKAGEIKSSEILPAILNAPATFAVSPNVFPRPAEFPAHVHVSGQFERSKTSDWNAPQSLQEFLDKHPDFLFLTFGSMRGPEPEQLSKDLVDILNKLEIPAIINIAEGGLVEIDASDSIYFVNRIPYDWILPKARAIIHHGGAGTTHAAMRAGVPTMIVPHIIDQFFWNQLNSDLGLGPKGPAVSKIRLKSLEKRTQALWNGEEYRAKCRRIADAMATEDLLDDFTSLLEGERLKK
jgi:UDP:flavonoid glycosyltransferase YjiC (YdhE family)